MADTVRLPRAWLRGTHDFSFSGVMTAVLQLMRTASPPPVAAVAKGFQEAVVDVLVEKTSDAARELAIGEVMLSGGVAANGFLRQELARRSPAPVARAHTEILHRQRCDDRRLWLLPSPTRRSQRLGSRRRLELEVRRLSGPGRPCLRRA